MPHRRRLHLCLRAGCRWRFRGNLCSVPERSEGRSDQASVRERPREGPRGPPSLAAAPRRSMDDARGPHVTSKVLLSGGCVLTLGAKTPNFHAGRRPDRRGHGGRGRHRHPCAGRRAGGRDRHDRHARLRRHAPSRLDLAVPEPRRRAADERAPTPAERSADRFDPRTSTPPPCRPAGRGRGRHHHGRRLVARRGRPTASRRPRSRRMRTPGLRTVFVARITGRRTASARASSRRGAGPSTSDRVRVRRRPRDRLGAVAARGRRHGSWACGSMLHAGSRAPGRRDRRRGAAGSWVRTSRSCTAPGSMTPMSMPSRPREPRSRWRPRARWRAARGSPPIQQLIDPDIRPGLGIDDERVTPGRHVRPDAGDDLDAARHRVRPQAGGQGRRPAPDEHARRHPLRDRRRRPGGGPGSA